MSRAVIVEPRKHPALEPVVANMAAASPMPITIVHGTANSDFAREIAGRNPRVDVLAQFDAANLDIVGYNQLLLHPNFWDNLGATPGDKIVVFQTDSGICRMDAGPGPALQSDYCGAPWLLPKRPPSMINAGFFISFCVTVLAGFIASVVLASQTLVGRGPRGSTGGMAAAMALTVGGTIGVGLTVGPRYGGLFQPGNGGFSVRDLDTARRHAQEFQDAGGYPTDDQYVAEDVYFSYKCEDDPHCNVCSPGDALRFSEDSVMAPGAWGFHKNWSKIARPLCPFNSTVRRLYTTPFPSPKLPVPGRGWIPTVQVVWTR